MAAAHQNAIRAIGECINHQVGMNHAAALDADDPYIGGILDARRSCQVSRGIGAPVACISDDQGFIIIQNYTSKAAIVIARK